MILLACLTAAILLTVIPVSAGSTEKNANWNRYWVKTYGRGTITDVVTTPAGDIIAVGSIQSDKTGGNDALVMKLNPEGQVIWARAYGGSADDAASSVAVTKNGSIIVAGWTNSFGAGNCDGWVLELNQNGDVLWQRTYGGVYDDRFSSVSITPDGDFVVAGWTNSFGTDAGNWPDAWVLKISPKGNVIWEKTYGENRNSNSEAKAIAVLPNGNIVVAGVMTSSTWVMKLNPNGSIIWQRMYREKGSSQGCWANALSTAPDGKVVVAGYTSNFGAWIIELDRDGNVIWQGGYRRGLVGGEADAMAVDDNGDVIIAGKIEGNIWLVALNNRNSVLWSKVYRSGGANSIALTRNGDIVIGGFMRDRALVMRLPPSGSLTGCKFCQDLYLVAGRPSIEVWSASLAVNTSHATVQSSDAVVSTIGVNVKKLYPYPGTLKVSSNPERAKVYVNGRYLGDTPIYVNLSPGEYNLSLKDPGYTTCSTVVEIRPRETTNVDLKLTPEEGYLSVVSTPPNASVYIDGAYRGRTPISGMGLPAGKHVIVVEKEGYSELTSTVFIKPGEITHLRFLLKPSATDQTSSTADETSSIRTRTAISASTSASSPQTAGKGQYSHFRRQGQETAQRRSICGPGSMMLFALTVLVLAKRGRGRR